MNSGRGQNLGKEWFKMEGLEYQIIFHPEVIINKLIMGTR